MSPAAEAFARLRAGDARRRTEFTVQKRRAVLKRLASEIRAREAEIMAALAADLGKPAVEVRISEIIPILSEIRHTSRHLKAWAGVRRARPGTIPCVWLWGLWSARSRRAMRRW